MTKVEYLVILIQPRGPSANLGFAQVPRKKIVLLKKVVHFYMCAHDLLPPRPKQLDVVANNLFGRRFPLCGVENYPRVGSSSHAKCMAFPPYGAHGSMIPQ